MVDTKLTIQYLNVFHPFTRSRPKGLTSTRPGPLCTGLPAYTSPNHPSTSKLVLLPHPPSSHSDQVTTSTPAVMTSPHSCRVEVCLNENHLMVSLAFPLKRPRGSRPDTKNRYTMRLLLSRLRLHVLAGLPRRFQVLQGVSLPI